MWSESHHLEAELTARGGWIQMGVVDIAPGAYPHPTGAGRVRAAAIPGALTSNLTGPGATIAVGAEWTNRSR
ncbi:hypothetical protein Mkiyose1665_00110 [Mycobacterium kiyosense]|uniref:Uncharacterized protein n=1 Tax=Mycobacterium kiyosense TaxID=2871094 RepID=A0A9P3Q4G3_9MYCO|nr:hypothetical protein MKCMC460_47180 [Mycobacterium sp. 20KCMC460]GLB80748.1 hypothetical protein SRL2020028_00040 [Mycobacterium kiyosense]GLB87514.1 hypothetical protein SRL2020130_03310 [Mycobacterium kiyosense]GLB93228.1 hypothetical protein SRL2020226_00040 [Mycobacterium kiyosense]GLB99437.1 hypothetical protein SRL2020400_00290 [Mycobacterium kiyosense]